MLTRGGRVTDTNDLKVFIDDLILRNILVNKGNTEDYFRIGGNLHTNINDFEVDNTISNTNRYITRKIVLMTRQVLKVSSTKILMKFLVRK